jgi:antitoxin (DNA-binding transcriptional repressor) of toxin-antitoxin stability system
MIQVTIHDAERALTELIQKALNGERVFIAEGSQPLVELVAFSETPQVRGLGGAKNSVLAMADDFDKHIDIKL